MPLLSHLTLRIPFHAVHGVSWQLLRRILKLPNLRHLSLDNFIPSPTRFASDKLNLHAIGPITSFSYTVFNSRNPYRLPSESEALSLILRTLHNSLEILVLPSEPAPLTEMFELEWPLLRELRLRGERWDIPDTPIVSLLSCMPNLRVLVLELTHPEEMAEQAMWPHGDTDTGPFPCPNLEQLTLANPLPHDELWTHLPHSIHTLSLCSCPPYTHRGWHMRPTPGPYRGSRYRFPLLSSTELLSILTRCPTPHMRALEIEYGANHAEWALLRYVASAYPGLTTLQIRRYRAEGEGDILLVRHVSCSLRSRHLI